MPARVTADPPRSACALASGLLTSENFSESARAAYAVRFDRKIGALVEQHETSAKAIARIMADRDKSAEAVRRLRKRRTVRRAALEAIVAPVVLDVDHRLTKAQKAGGFARRLNPNDVVGGSLDPSPFAVAGLAAQIAGLRA